MRLNALRIVPVLAVTFFCVAAPVSVGTSVVISAAYAQNAAPNASTSCASATSGCLVYGAILVPGKLELTGNRDVFGSASLGGYVGYRLGQAPLPVLEDFGIGGFFGFTQNIGGQSTSGSAAGAGSSQPGVTYGGTIFYSIPDSKVTLGFVVGFDHLANSLHYAYNDKPWISFSVGLGF